LINYKYDDTGIIIVFIEITVNNKFINTVDSHYVESKQEQEKVRDSDVQHNKNLLYFNFNSMDL
jgi:hypothetical protein